AASVAWRGWPNASPVTARKRAAPQPAICSAAAPVAAPTSPTVSAPPRVSAVARASTPAFASDPSASVCASKRMFSTLFFPHPGDYFARDLFGRHILYNARLALLFGQRHGGEGQPRVADLRRFGALQRGHHGAHVGHADLRIIARLGQVAGGPSEQRRRRRAHRYLVAPAFHALQHFEAAVVAHRDLVHTLELLGDA